MSAPARTRRTPARVAGARSKVRRQVRIRRLLVGTAAVATTALSGYGVAGANNTPPVPSPPPTDETRSLLNTAWNQLGSEERTEALRQLHPEEAEAMSQFLDQVSAGGSVPVSAEGRIVGYVDASTLAGNRMPAGQGQFGPVRDTTGRVVAYWGGPLGVVDRPTAEMPGLDVPRLARRRGLNPDGTVLTELLTQIPLPVESPLPLDRLGHRYPLGHRLFWRSLGRR
jgi:hypothetical protein